jgi:hypothetical protein
MPKPFDATLKDLAAINPADFVAAFDVPRIEPVRLLNVDLSTVTTMADVVFGLGDPLQEIVHVDCQANASADLHRDVLVYNALLHRQYRVPVHSIVLLLRREARHRNLDGTVRYEVRPGRGKMDFGFEVVNLWERPVDQLLRSSLGMLPLAVLGQMPRGMPLEAGLTQVVHQMDERLQREATPDQRGRLLAASFVLSGLRVAREQAQVLFRGVPGMQESTTYQAILEEGEAKGMQEALLLQGRKKFSGLDEAIRQRVRAITDLERLRQLHERMPDVHTWQELLQTP